jgi:hypothetical protein
MGWQIAFRRGYNSLYSGIGGTIPRGYLRFLPCYGKQQRIILVCKSDEEKRLRRTLKVDWRSLCFLAMIVKISSMLRYNSTT